MTQVSRQWGFSFSSLFVACLLAASACKGGSATSADAGTVALPADAGRPADSPIRYSVFVEDLGTLATGWPAAKPITVHIEHWKGLPISQTDAEAMGRSFTVVTYPDARPVDVDIAVAPRRPELKNGWEVTHKPRAELQRGWYAVLLPKLPEGFAHSYTNDAERFRRADGVLPSLFHVGSQPVVGAVIFCPADRAANLTVSLSEAVEVPGPTITELPINVANADASRGQPRCAQAYPTPPRSPEEAPFPYYSAMAALKCDALDSEGGVINIAIPVSGRRSREGGELSVPSFFSGARLDGDLIRLSIPTDSLWLDYAGCRGFVPALMGQSTVVE